MKILVVVDMQNDFIDGALGTKEAAAILPLVQKKIEDYRGEKIYFTRDTHPKNYLKTQEGKHLPVVHCIEHTPGWEISTALSTENAEIVDKPTFGSLELVRRIVQDKPESIELVGVCTDICVISNALLLKAALPETPIYVDASCCAGVTPESHQNALNAMKMCQIEISE